MFDRLGRIEAKMGTTRIDFFETHPSSEKRIKVRKFLFRFFHRNNVFSLA